MMDQRMEQQFAFALEVDKLKNIFRQTRTPTRRWTSSG